MAENFRDVYNRLGKKKKKRQTKAYTSSYDPAIRRHPKIVAARAGRARRGGPNVPSSISRAARSGGGSTGLSNDPARLQTSWDRVIDQLTADYTEATNKQEAVNRTTQYDQDQAASENPGIFERLVGGLIGSPATLASNNPGLATSPVGSALYQLGRPTNALFQAQENLAAQQTHRGYSPSDLAFTLGNFGSGFGEGWNYEQGVSGAGQVYEAIKENPTSDFGTPLRELEEAHPNWEQALAITAGATGEVFGDFYGLAAPAAPSIMRSTGRTLTREGLQEAVQAAGRQGVQDGLSAAPSLFGRSPLSPDMIAARAEAAMDDALNNTVLGVSRGGAPHTRTLGGDAFPSTVSQKWGQSVIDSISGHAEEMVTRVRADPSSLQPWDIAARKQTSRDFTEFWDDLTNQLKAAGHPITGGPTRIGGRMVDTSIDEVLAILKGGGQNDLVDSIWTNIRNGHFVELQPHIDEVYKAVENPVTRTVGVRLGKKVVPVPLVGRAFAYAGDKIGQIPGIKGMGSFLYEKQFPGLFANKISRASAYGVKGLDNFMRDLEKIAKGFTPEEGKDLFKALGDHTFQFGDKRMDDALDWLRKQRETRFVEELREGARSIDDESGALLNNKQYDPNYQFIHLKGGTKGARKRFNKGRKDQWRDHGNYVGYGIEEAKKKGLRPVDDAFQAMQLHYMDSANRITNSYLWQDLAANYGSMPGRPVTGISVREATERGLTALGYDQLSAAFKQAVKDSGGKFYIPNSMYDMGKAFDEMMDWSTASMGRFGRSFNKVINQFKLWSTIPYPGFHVRNFMGDTMMGMLDGVPPTRYTEIMKKYAASRAGRAANFEIVPGYSMTFKELMQQFRNEANASYLKVDVGLTSTKTAGKIAGIGRTVGKKVRDISDDRELLPRFTHYTHAFKEEAKALWNSGMRDTDKILAQARDAALWRVNHYKFDYNALMPWERQLKAMAFPFYTYTRKAIPTLVEQMFINPHYFQMVNRFQMDNDGSAADAFNYMNVPQFWRDFGVSMATDEKEPLGLTGEIFPTSALDVLSSNSLGEAAGDMISMMNPAFQIPYELRSGRRAFDDRPIEGGTFDYLMSKIPFVGDLQERFSSLPGIPGESPYPVTSGENPWSWDKWVSDRLLGGGISLRRASLGQQEQQMETNFDDIVEAQMNDFNNSQDRIRIAMNEESNFEVTDRYTGEMIGQYRTPQEAIQFASTLPQVKHDTPSPLHPPTGVDFAQLLASQ